MVRRTSILVRIGGLRHLYNCRKVESFINSLTNKIRAKKTQWQHFFYQPWTNSSWASSGTATLGTINSQPPSALACESEEFEEECLAKNDSIPVSTTDTINWMLARVLQAAGIEARTNMVHEESRMNCNMNSRVTLSTSPTGEQLFNRLSSSDIIRHTSEAVLAGSTPERENTHV